MINTETNEDADEEFIHPEVLWIYGAERPDSLDAVLGLLNGDDLGWRRIAAYELGNFNEPSVVSTLHNLLEDSDIHVRECSIQALANLNDKTAVKPLCDILARSDTEYSICSNAIKALADLRDSRALSSLYPLLNSENPWVRYDAAFALGEIGDPEAVAYLTAIVSDDAMPEADDDDEELAYSTGWSVGENAQKAINKILGLDDEAEENNQTDTG